MPNVKKQIKDGKHALVNFKKQQTALTGSVRMPKATRAKPTGKVGYPALYKPAICSQLIEAGEKGLTKIQFCAKIGISKDTFYTWRDSHPEFKEAIQIYEAKIEAWYTSLIKNKMLGIRQMVNGMPLNLDLGGLVWFGKNVCNWRDKQEQVISVGTNIVEVTKEENELV